MKGATAVLIALLATVATAQEKARDAATGDPDADAIIVRWEQTFTLENDGTMRRRERRLTKVLTPRAIRALADPRIDYCEGEDEVIVHAARTHLPEGEILPVPDYSHNVAAPDDVAGWPTWANWRQKIVSFSGIRPGVVLELDYEVITKPGVVPWLTAELRLDADYPVERHVVVLNVPRWTYVNHSSAHGPTVARSEGEGPDVYRWSATNLPAGRAEPQSAPWRDRCPFVAFTTCNDHPDWVRAFTRPVDDAATADDAIRAFAAKAAEGAKTDEERVRKVIARIKATTHRIDSWKTWRSRRCRPAAVVFRDAYGSPLEIAALAAAAIRSLGLAAELGIGTEDVARWGGMITPADAAFSDIMLMVAGAEGEILARPHEGVIRRCGDWPGHTLLEVGPEGPRSKEGRIWRLTDRGEDEVSEIAFTGSVSVDEKGRLAGEIEVRLTGLFFDPRNVESADGQEKFLTGVVRRLLPDVEVAAFAIRALSDDALVAMVTVAGKKPLPETGGARMLVLADGPAFLADVPMPLESGARRTDVWLRGAFRETVDLKVKWKGHERPALQRTIEVPNRRLSPAEFERLRREVNSGRATATTTVLLE